MTYKTLKVRLDEIHLIMDTFSLKFRYMMAMMVKAMLVKCNMDIVTSLDRTVGVSLFNMKVTNAIEVMNKQKTPDISIR